MAAVFPATDASKTSFFHQGLVFEPTDISSMDSLLRAASLALGLVSFGLAVAINALAAMVGEIAYVGWIVAALVLVGGHLFSFVLNLMGAFAHGVRLHFVEFFGKFYDGGGDDFTPFSVKREITEKQ